MNNRNVMGEDEWARREEEVAALGDVIDIGIGRDAREQTGLSLPELADIVRANLYRLTDEGADLLTLFLPGRRVSLYVRWRGRHVDAGTRQDFSNLGWEVLCDLLDRSSTEAP